MLWTAPGVKLPSYRKNGFKASWWRCECLDTSPEPSNGHCFDRETCETPQKTFQLAAVVKDVMQNVHCLESLKTISKR